jgi:hypothetical protein
MFANATIAFALALNGWALAAAQAGAPFQRDAAVKLLGYDPESATLNCSSNKHSVASVARGGPGKTDEERVVLFLKASGELSAAHVGCPSATSEQLAPFVQPNEVLSGAVCRAAAAGAGGEITEHVSELINIDHPDVVAAYADGVANALGPIRDACTTTKEAWAKVATQALLFENRANALRQGRVCALWRLALDKELKAATATGQSKGRAAGLSYFQTRTSAALDGAHHYCAEDETSSLLDANVGLTKMLLETMPDK